MKECIFCQIVKGKIPCHKIYEDDNFLAFLDINPVTQGHTLVIPKEHYRWVWDIPDEELGELFKVVKKIARSYQKVFQDSFVPSAIWGLDVEHAHVQLLPQAKELGFWKHGKLDKGKVNELVKKLRVKDGNLD